MLVPTAHAVGYWYVAPHGAKNHDGYYIELTFLTANCPLPTANLWIDHIVELICPVRVDGLEDVVLLQGGVAVVLGQIGKT
jgi:hypothetical protein